MADQLDAYAEDLPPCVQPYWIAEVVRTFCGARGLSETNELYDYWHEAVMVAFKRRYLALRRDADPVAYVKRGVRFYLIDLNRKFDVRTENIALVAPTADEAEDPDAPCNPSMEDYDRSAFAGREEVELKRLDDVRVAIYATIAHAPQLAAYWRAFSKTNGSDRTIADRLDIHRKTVAKVRRHFAGRFAENYLMVRRVRGKAA